MATFNSNSNSSRRLRAFKRWMKCHGVLWNSDAIDFIEEEDGQGVAVQALSHLKEGDVVAKIPKSACLTIKTSGASQLIESAELDGTLGLSVALMYERSLGAQSPWAGYLQILPPHECLPLLWTPLELDSLLSGTELHCIVKQDKTLVCEDWEENIMPLLNDSESIKLDPTFFGLDQYFAAKSLIASRSFQIDEYHGSGMVPLADLFNHKTGAEDVHFTAVPSLSESDSDDYETNGIDDSSPHSLPSEESDLSGAPLDNGSLNNSESESSLALEDDSKFMEMIILKDVKAGTEVFNTYGTLGNASLLHRYGFTELNNPYDIINIDLELVLKWSLSLFSDRHSRGRLAIWRKLNYSGCVNQNSEYFEISFDGEPEFELLILLHIVLLPDDAYYILDQKTSTGEDSERSTSIVFSDKSGITWKEVSDTNKDMLLTRTVCDALLWLADARERLYGSNSIEDDIEALRKCSVLTNRKLFHSLMLRVSERRILEKLRVYAAARARSVRTGKKTSARKKLKKK